MLWTAARASAAPNITRSLQNLLPNKLPPSLAGHPGNLYEVLSRTPAGGIGKQVHQIRWGAKDIPDSYWVVTRAQFKCEGKHGKAWGRLHWKGNLVSKREERIRGSLKYKWAEGRSKVLEKAAA